MSSNSRSTRSKGVTAQPSPERRTIPKVKVFRFRVEDVSPEEIEREINEWTTRVIKSGARDLRPLPMTSGSFLVVMCFYAAS